jgi:methylated-DNA-[protein]-cysteine S-methyltransferase
MNVIHTGYWKSPLGELILGSFGDCLCLCDWRYRKQRALIDRRIRKGLNAEFCEASSHIVQTAISQLEDYFAGSRTIFDIPLQMVGTPFQKKVWNALEDIPYGETISYNDLTLKLATRETIRAVAAANGANAIAIIIPCHRVVGSRGEPTGYAGGLKVKKELLQLESPGKESEQLELFNP